MNQFCSLNTLNTNKGVENVTSLLSVGKREVP